MANHLSFGNFDSICWFKLFQINKKPFLRRLKEDEEKLRLDWEAQERRDEGYKAESYQKWAELREKAQE